MIKIGCNWSDGLRELLLNFNLDVDYIKTAALDDTESQITLMRSFKPILLHGLGYSERTGMRDFDKIDFDRANRLLSECGSPHYALHLGIKNSDMDGELSDEDILWRMSRNLQCMKRALCVPVLVENAPDSPKDRRVFDHRPFAKPELITEVVERNDVDFLLDLTHAKITAQFNRSDVHDYLKRLPLHRVREMHVNGSGHDEGGVPADTHQEMAGEDYELLQWVLHYAHPEIVTLEYSGIESEDAESIKGNITTQLEALRKLFERGV